MNPLVLVAGISTVFTDKWRFDLGDEIEVLRVGNVREAKVLFGQNQKKIVLIAVGITPVSSFYETPLQLTVWYAKRFAGPILTFSINEKEARRGLVRGAKHWCRTEEVPEKIKEILSQTLQPLSTRTRN